MSKVKTYEPLQKITIEATEDLPVRRFVGFDGKKCGSAKKAAGITEYAWNNGDIGSIVRAGTTLLELGANVTAIGSALKSDANGKGVPALSLSATVPAGGTAVLSSSAQPAMTIQGGVLPEFINAYAMETGSAGDIIKVMLV